MGQSSTFITNRLGSFQFWNECWDSKNSFNKSITEHFFLKKFFYLFIKNKSYTNWYNLKKIKKNLNFLFFNSLNLNTNLNNFLKNKKLNNYKPILGNFYILKFNSWLFIKIFIFFKNKNKMFNLKKKVKIKRVLMNKVFFNFNF